MAADLAGISAKLSNLQCSLSELAKSNFGSINKQTANLRKQLENPWKRQPSVARDKEIKSVSSILDELLHREELMWRQRSRALWLREGDKNTKYFQCKASWRRKRNTISKLKDEEGVWVEDRSKLQ